MMKCSEMVGQFVGWIARGHKEDFIQTELARGCLRGPKVPHMDRIERSTENSDVQ